MNIKNMIRNISISRIIFGVLLVGLGAYSIMNPETTIGTLGFIFALYAIISGILDIAMYFVFETRIGYAPAINFIAGLISIIAGFIMFNNPAATATMIGLLFPLWFMATCISKLSQLPLIRFYSGTFSYWLSLIVSAFGFVLSIYLLFNPLTSLIYTISFIAAYLIFFGVEVFIEGLFGIKTTRSLD